MNETERLDEALKTLRAADAGRGASPFLETRLRAAFREKHAPKPRPRWTWIGILATAAMALFVFWQLSAPRSVEAPPEIAEQSAPAVTAPIAPESSEDEMVAVAPPPAGRRVPARRPEPVAPSRQEPVDAVSASAGENPFIALPYAPPLAPTDRGQVMRVRMPRQTLRHLGVPVIEERILERVPADVLLGEDGIPRAIRFVNGR